MTLKQCDCPGWKQVETDLDKAFNFELKALLHQLKLNEIIMDCEIDGDVVRLKITPGVVRVIDKKVCFKEAKNILFGV